MNALTRILPLLLGMPISLCAVSLASATPGEHVEPAWDERSAEAVEREDNPFGDPVSPPRREGVVPAGGVQPTAEGVTSPLDRFRRRDASADRTLLLPTAETLEAGEFTVNSYQLFLIGASYGATDTTQISFTTLLPIIKDMPFVGLLQGKQQLFRDERSVASGALSLGFASADGQVALLLSPTLLYDRVLDDNARFKLSLRGSLTGAFAPGSRSSYDDFDIVSGRSQAWSLSVAPAILFAVSPRLQLLAEVIYLFAPWYEDGWDAPPFLNYGIRFTGPALSVDLALVRPLDRDVGETFPLGFPFVSFNARF